MILLANAIHFLLLCCFCYHILSKLHCTSLVAITIKLSQLSDFISSDDSDKKYWNFSYSLSCSLAGVSCRIPCQQTSESMLNSNLTSRSFVANGLPKCFDNLLLTLLVGCQTTTKLCESIKCLWVI